MRKRCFVLVVFCFFLLEIVSAFSVATLYSENYPLKMKPGESRETFFLLRNVVEGDSDVNVRSALVKGGEIANLLDGPIKYEVPFGKEVEVFLKVQIPEDIPIGTRYNIVALFRPIAEETTDGNIQFLVNIGKSIPVIVVDKKKESEYRDTRTLTLEDESEELVEKSAYSSKSKSVWFVAIISFLLGIIIMMVVIIFILKRRRGYNQISQQGSYFNQ